ncbi:EH signature domain-containing protein [Aeromonas veronii]
MSKLENLTERLGATLLRWDGGRIQLSPSLSFSKLTQQAEQACAQFGNTTAPPPPPLEQRLNAFIKLRRTPVQMQLCDWRLVAWGLADLVPTYARAIEDTALFTVILKEFNARLTADTLNRKMWFGLLSSYLSYKPEAQSGLECWKQLRELLKRAFEQFKGQQKSPKRWIAVVEQYRDIFSDAPGKQLAKELSEDKVDALQVFKTYLPIPDESWFWKSMINNHLNVVTALNDEAFVTRIEPMLAMTSILPSVADTVLARLLTRYAESSRQDQSHKALKEAALQRWGSPQIGSSRNRWSVNVEDYVCKMVMRWFAKEDLETFFKLLQGERGVDRDRLEYWLRFVDQIGFTRLVLGPQAMQDYSSDFVEFRRKNKDRISQLKGGTSEDNAFIMQIGDYVIVEFSKKGNACYFRPYDQNLPFKLDTKILELTPELKGKSKGCESLPHTPTDRGWWHKYDRWFAERGIYPDKQPPTKQPSNKLSAVRQAQQGSTSPMPNKGSIEQAISQALQFIEAESVKFSITDFRDNGGAFWLMIPTPYQGLQNRLLGLGFQYKQGRGYWIK